MTEVAYNNIETATQRELARRLVDALGENVTVTRSLLNTPPDRDRVSVFPGEAPATTLDLFLGNNGRARRGDDFTVRVWVEVLRDDQDDAEDVADSYVAQLEDIVAENPTLGTAVPGLLMFGQRMTREAHPCVEIQPGVHFRWVEIEIAATGRYA